jgi:hypothetical protein
MVSLLLRITYFEKVHLPELNLDSAHVIGQSFDVYNVLDDHVGTYPTIHAALDAIGYERASERFLRVECRKPIGKISKLFGMSITEAARTKGAFVLANARRTQ